MTYDKRAPAFAFEGSAESCLLRIRSHYDGLLPSQKRIADFITSRKGGILALDVTSLAKQAGVCAASITRFCRRIGFTSFREFKIALAQETASVPIVFDQFSEADDDTARTSKIFAAYIQSLIDTRAIVSIPSLILVADRVAKSEFVHLYGVGTSGTMAQEAGLRLTFAGVPNRPHVDVYEQIISASLVTRKDTAIGFSHSGASVNTVESIRIARQHGAFTVAVTNYAGSPLAKAADVCLLTSLPEKAAHVATLSSRVAQLTLVECLYAAVGVRKLEKFKKNASEADREAKRILQVPVRTGKGRFQEGGGLGSPSAASQCAAPAPNNRGEIR